MKKDSPGCSKREAVTLGVETMTAQEWAARRGIKWVTVKVRRARGFSWAEALGPLRRRLLDPYR